MALQRWRAITEYYVGLDVSLKQTSICVVDQAGLVVREAVVDSDHDDIDLRDVEGTECSTHWPRDGTDVYVAVDRAQATWPAGDLY